MPIHLSVPISLLLSLLLDGWRGCAVRDGNLNGLLLPTLTNASCTGCRDILTVSLQISFHWSVSLIPTVHPKEQSHGDVTEPDHNMTTNEPVPTYLPTSLNHAPHDLNFFNKTSLFMGQKIVAVCRQTPLPITHTVNTICASFVTTSVLDEGKAI